MKLVMVIDESKKNSSMSKSQTIFEAPHREYASLA